MTEDMCAFCGGPKSLRNPSGACDHLYWPDLLTEEAKRANGLVPVQTDDLIERQQKAIDLLLRAIEPFAETMSFFLEDGFDDDDIDKILLGSNISPAHLRAARSAREQAERILKEGK